MTTKNYWINSLPDDLRQLCIRIRRASTNICKSNRRIHWQTVQPLPQENLRRLWQRLRIEWNYNSNHIEGNTLTYGETLLLLIHGRTRGEHLIREYEEMRGHDVAIEFVQMLAQEARLVSEGDIRDLNRIILKEGFWRVAQTLDGEPTRKWIDPGSYKTQQNHVFTPSGEIFYFAAPEETPARMADFVQWLRMEMDTPSLTLPMLLAKLHHEFIRIHPFDDGNGRVVRLLMNYFLMRVDLLPMVIKSQDRNHYLEVIACADAGDLKPLGDFFINALQWSLQLGLEAVVRLIDLQTVDV